LRLPLLAAGLHETKLPGISSAQIHNGGKQVRRFRVTVGVLIGIAGLVLAGSAPAAAYGTGAAYQVGLSFNCQNTVTCVASQSNPFGIGGVWGWIVVDQYGNVDGELEFQGHQNANPALNGSGHLALSAVAVPTTFQAPFTPTDPKGQYLAILQCGSAGCQPVFEIDATPGHYAQNFGPGINNELQVSQLP
jgi:hypothetical protein